MNRKNIAFTGTLVLSCASLTVCAPSTQAAGTKGKVAIFNSLSINFQAINSQKEFDKAFNGTSDAKILNLAGHAYDNQNARLFWFTDLEAAKRQAKVEGKPILSLRLLGKLSDEYSCANSRFFRVLFYANKQINPILRDKFILHWSSERPVPVVTIDFGDGKKIKQTITGNSAHYLLDETGRPLDVLPGLYSPQAFETWLTTGEKLAANWKAESGESREQTLRKWHEARISAIWSERTGAGNNVKWVEEQTQQSLKNNPFFPQLISASNQPVSARTAAPLAVSKRAIEAPMLDATNLFSTSARLTVWRWGNPTQSDVKLDEETKAHIKAMNPRLSESGTALERAGVAEGVLSSITLTQFMSSDLNQKPEQVEPFDAMIRNFEQSISVDTSANKYRMEIPIHALFAKGEEGNFESLNRKIYDTLFLTPKSDPYLGLGADGVFTGLQNGGIIQTAPQQ